MKPERCKTCGREYNGIVRIPTGLLAARYSKDGKKILVLTKIGKNGVEHTEKYLVDHLLNDDGNVTEQTIEQEGNLFPRLEDVT